MTNTKMYYSDAWEASRMTALVEKAVTRLIKEELRKGYSVPAIAHMFSTQVNFIAAYEQMLLECEQDQAKD